MSSSTNQLLPLIQKELSIVVHNLVIHKMFVDNMSNCISNLTVIKYVVNSLCSVLSEPEICIKKKDISKVAEKGNHHHTTCTKCQVYNTGTTITTVIDSAKTFSSSLY